jgi:SAM-dependent methyltransferase
VVDLALPPGTDPRFFRQANLSVQPIPHDDSSFDSVSAFDFLEHVPRVLATADGRGTRYPFIELMNEIHRVLRPGGRFYAVTPAFPHSEATSDPTHVNIIGAKTHRYFTDTPPGARIYGFSGTFQLIRAQWLRKRRAYEPVSADLVHRARHIIDILKRRRAHMLWEFEAVKSPGSA